MSKQAIAGIGIALVVVIGIVVALFDGDSTGQQALTNDEVVGTYTGEINTDEFAGTLNLDLATTNLATLTTNYENDQPTVQESGSWQVATDNRIAVEIANSTSSNLTFAKQNGTLEATAYPTSTYGTEGITLTRVGTSDDQADQETDSAGTTTDTVQDNTGDGNDNGESITLTDTFKGTYEFTATISSVDSTTWQYDVAGSVPQSNYSMKVLTNGPNITASIQKEADLGATVVTDVQSSGEVTVSEGVTADDFSFMVRGPNNSAEGNAAGDNTTAGEPNQRASVGTTARLTASDWKWERTVYVNGEVVTPDQPEEFVLTFDTDGRFGAETDCNTIAGDYSASGNSLTFDNMLATEVACPQGSQEEEFTDMLANTVSFNFDADGNLTLNLESGSGSVVFAPPGS